MKYLFYEGHPSQLLNWSTFVCSLFVNGLKGWVHLSTSRLQPFPGPSRNDSLLAPDVDRWGFLMLCFGFLSCWNVNLHPSLRSWASWKRFSVRMDSYFSGCIFPSALIVLGTVAERHDAQSDAATTVFDCRDGVNEAGTFQRCRNGSPIGLCTDTMLSRRSVELIAYFFPSLDMTQFPSVQVSQLNTYL